MLGRLRRQAQRLTRIVQARRVRLLRQTWGRAEALPVIGAALLAASAIAALSLLLTGGSSQPRLAANHVPPARPPADVSFGGWGVVPLFGKLNEVTADDETSQITSGINPI